MGVVEELRELVDLKKAGFLTDEQFEAAKTKVLGGGGTGAAATTAAPAPAPAAATGSSGGSVADAPAAAPAHPERDLPAAAAALAATPAAAADLSRACALLQTLLGNVARAPAEERFRLVKTTNARLADELFSVAGVAAFLEGVGFARVDGGFYFGARGVPLGAADAAHAAACAARVAVVARGREIRERDVKVRLVREAIRAEIRADHAAEGTIVHFCRSELLDQEDLPSLAAQLRAALEGDAPVSLTEEFRTACWHRGGTQELLLDVAGWSVEETAPAASAAELPRQRVVPPPGYAAAAVAADGEEEGVEEEGSESRRASVLGFLGETVELFEAARAREEEEKRDEARKAVKAIVAQHRGGVEKKKQAAAAAAAAAEASPAKAGEGSGRRVWSVSFYPPFPISTVFCITIAIPYFGTSTSTHTHTQIAVKDALKYLRGEHVPVVDGDGNAVGTTTPAAPANLAAMREEDATATRLINEIMGFVVCVWLRFLIGGCGKKKNNDTPHISYAHRTVCMNHGSSNHVTFNDKHRSWTTTTKGRSPWRTRG